MDLSSILYFLLFPSLIFFARMADVTLGTIRIIMVSRGLKYTAPIVGFFEVLIWLLAMRQIMMNLTAISYYLAYASGFAMGNFVGMWLEEKLAMGYTILRIITQKDASELITHLRSNNFGVTSIDGCGAEGPVKIVFAIIKRKDLNVAINIINHFNPQAFYSLEDVRRINEGIFPKKTSRFDGTSFHPFKSIRKSK